MAASDELVNLHLGELLEALASDVRGPGAGSAAGLVVALAAALCRMTARLSRPGWDEAGGASAQADSLRLRVAPLVRADAEAYADASAELRSRSAGESGERDERLGETLARAAAIPLRIAEAGADVAELAVVIAEGCDRDLRADAVGAALFAEAGTRVAARLVDVNLATTGSDPRVEQAGEFATRARSAAERAVALSA